MSNIVRKKSDTTTNRHPILLVQKTDHVILNKKSATLLFPYPIFKKPTYLSISASHSQRTVCYDINEETCTKDDSYTAPPIKKRKLTENTSQLNQILCKEKLIQHILQSHVIFNTPIIQPKNPKTNTEIIESNNNAFASNTPNIINSKKKQTNQNQSNSIQSIQKKLSLPYTINPFVERDATNNNSKQKQCITHENTHTNAYMIGQYESNPITSNPTQHILPCTINPFVQRDATNNNSIHYPLNNKKKQNTAYTLAGNAFANEAEIPFAHSVAPEINEFFPSDYGVWNDDIQFNDFTNDMYGFTSPPFACMDFSFSDPDII